MEAAGAGQTCGDCINSHGGFLDFPGDSEAACEGWEHTAHQPALTLVPLQRAGASSFKMLWGFQSAHGLEINMLLNI